MTRVVAALLIVASLLAGCTSRERPPATSSRSPSTTTPEPDGAPTDTALAPTPPLAEPSENGAGHPALVRTGDVSVTTAWSVVRHLAGVIGPRPGTSRAFARAVGFVARRLQERGYVVRTPGFQVPAGVSWGIPVEGGRSVNVVATVRGFDPRRPHLVVGAHLDTVPQAPGAEDNASGVGVLLAVAEALAGHRARLPVAFVAFGSEEPRGPTDDDHHYGSRAYVAAMGPRERAAVRGMVSLDRVGVGEVLPVCSATSTPGRARAEVLAAARRAGVAVQPCVDNRASDHWSFVRSGLPGVRIGSTPYAAYHSADDLPAVIDRAQLARAARTTVAWLRGP